jgi:hypothetical protein
MVALTGIELEPFSRRERSGSLLAKSRPLSEAMGRDLGHPRLEKDMVALTGIEPVYRP